MAASSETGYLDGQMLIAMPAMGDSRFERSVIYLCAHSAEGAMGIVVNQRATNVNFTELLSQLKIITDEDPIELPEVVRQKMVHLGGPVETGRGFVLHSSDYYIENTTLPIDEDICLTATLEILKAIAVGEGPRQSLLALGYAGWAPGQLESEIQANGWLHCPADQQILFESDLLDKYGLALAKIGIDPIQLTSEAGHA